MDNSDNYVVSLLILQLCRLAALTIIIFTTRSELRKVLFLAPSVCDFFLCMKHLGNRRTDLRQIHMEAVFGPSLG